MDHRFPLWLRRTVDKLSFLGLPNLAGLITALAVLAFIARTTGATPVDRFLFDPYLIRQGEWWRLFAFPVSEGMHPLFFMLYALYIYFIIQAVESHWGEGPTTIFILLSYIGAMLGSFLTLEPTTIWYYVLLNVSLAFGTLFPNYEILLYFILPVKAKWLAYLSGVILIFQFVMGGVDRKIFLFCAMFSYLLFFGPYLFTEVRAKIKNRRHKQRYDKDMWR